jgi:hypothetical protein
MNVKRSAEIIGKPLPLLYSFMVFEKEEKSLFFTGRLPQQRELELNYTKIRAQT